jgi:hypothetical protein
MLSPQPPAPRAGSALLASLMTVTLVAAMGAVLLQTSTSIARRGAQAIDRKRALYVAEAGLSEAWLAVAQGRSGNVGSPEIPATFGDGFYWVVATLEPQRGLVFLHSTALCGRGRFSLREVVSLPVNPVATLGAFGADGMTVGAGGRVDGYDSRLTTPQVDDKWATAGALGLIGRVASGGDVVLAGGEPTYILGTVSPGPAGNLSTGPSVVITGATAPLAAVPRLPPVSLPDMPMRPPVQIAAGRTVTLNKRDASVQRLVIQRGATGVVVGPSKVVIDVLVLRQGATLVLDSSQGAIEFFVTGNAQFQPGSVLRSPAGRADNVVLAFDSLVAQDLDGDGRPEPALTFAAEGDFRGLLYAPGEDLTVPSGLRLTGAVVARNLTLAPGARVTWDRATATQVDDFAILPKHVSWRIAEVPSTALTDSGLDPRLFLAARGVAARPSSESAPEDTLRIQYFDDTDSPQEYTGPVRDFDFGKVKRYRRAWWPGKSAGTWKHARRLKRDD